MRMQFEQNRFSGSQWSSLLLLMALMLFGPTTPLQAQSETGIKLTIRKEEALTDADIEQAHAVIRQKLMQKIDLEFPEAELARVLELITKKLDVPLVIDPVGLEEAGVIRDQIISCNLPGITAKSALRIMLKPLNLRYVVENETLLITSTERAEHYLVVRTYDCRDLLELVPKIPVGNIMHTGGPLPDMTPEEEAKQARQPIQQIEIRQKILWASKEMMFDGDAITRLLISSVVPASWQDNGGQGTIKDFGGLVVVNQTDEVHEEIERLLTSMRELVKKGAAK